MSNTFQVGNSVFGTPINPLTASGKASTATLSNFQASSSDPTIFTVSIDTLDPGSSVLISGVGVGTASISGSATATEADGSTHQVTMDVDTITITAEAPPIDPAVSFGIAYSAPFVTPVATS